MSKAYADLVSNFLSSLTNLVLLRLDAYLLHAHPNLDAFRVRNLRAAPVSGGDLFERNLMQEYEQHLIGLGVKPGSKKEQRFHPYEKNKRGGVDVNRLNKGFTTNPCRHPSIWCNCPFFSHHHKVVAEEDVAVAGVVAAEAAQVVPSSSNLLNDIQYQVLPSKNPGLELTMLSGDPLHYVFPVTPLSVLTLLEREKTPCVQSPPEGEKTLCVLSLPEREKTPCVQSPEGEKTLCVQDISNQVQFNSVQEKLQNLPVGGQTEAVPSGMGKTRLPRVNYRAHKRQIQVALQRTPKLIQGTLHSQQLCRLRQTKCLMDLYSRPAAERCNRSRSYPRQSGILQPSLPGPKTRQPLEASHRFKYTKEIPGHPKIQDGDLRVHPRLPQKRGVGHIYRPHRRLPTCTYSHSVSEIPQVSFPRCHLPVHQPTFRASNSPPHFHQYSQGSKTHSLTIRNQAPQVPGRLVNPCPLKTNMHGSDSKTTKAGEGFGLYSRPQEVRPHSFTEV